MVVNARWVGYRGFLFKFLVVIVFFCECLEGSGDVQWVTLIFLLYLYLFSFVFVVQGSGECGGGRSVSRVIGD